MWSTKEITFGRHHIPTNRLYVRDGDDMRYQGSIHNSLSLECKVVDELHVVQVIIADESMVGFLCRERHDVKVPLQEFVDAIRDLARKQDREWQADEKRKAAKYAEAGEVKS